jgi:hypothetical protein
MPLRAIGTRGRQRGDIVIVDRRGSAVMHRASPAYDGRLDGRRRIAMADVDDHLYLLEPN